MFKCPLAWMNLASLFGCPQPPLNLQVGAVNYFSNMCFAASDAKPCRRGLFEVLGGVDWITRFDDFDDDALWSLWWWAHGNNAEGRKNYEGENRYITTVHLAFRFYFYSSSKQRCQSSRLMAPKRQMAEMSNLDINERHRNLHLYSFRAVLKALKRIHVYYFWDDEIWPLVLIAESLEESDSLALV